MGLTDFGACPPLDRRGDLYPAKGFRGMKSSYRRPSSYVYGMSFLLRDNEIGKLARRKEFVAVVCLWTLEFGERSLIYPWAVKIVA